MIETRTAVTFLCTGVAVLYFVNASALRVQPNNEDAVRNIRARNTRSLGRGTFDRFRSRLRSRSRSWLHGLQTTVTPSSEHSERLATVETNFRKLSSLVLHQTVIQQHLKGRLDEIRRDLNNSKDNFAGVSGNHSKLIEDLVSAVEDFDYYMRETDDFATDVGYQLLDLKATDEAMQRELGGVSKKTTNLTKSVDKLATNLHNISREFQEDASNHVVSVEQLDALQRRLEELERRLNTSGDNTFQDNGCPSPRALGVSDGRIRNEAMSGSDFYASSNGPHYARLNSRNAWFTNLRTTTSYGRDGENLDWLKIDLGEPHLVAGVATQGANEYGYYRTWVTKYRMSFSLDGETWTTYRTGNSEEITGNCDDETVERHNMDTPVRARYVMLEPLSFDCNDYHKPRCYLGMRVELYGCTL